MSGIVLAVILFFLFISVINKNFWCRYFCPYGALIGILAYISPIKITRNTQKCIDCGKCSRACPSYLPVDKKIHVLNHECLACYDCVNVCPVDGALDMKLAGKKKKIHYGLYAIMLVGLFVVITNTARATGHWYTSISDAEFIMRVKELDLPKYQHKAGKFETE